NHRKRPFAVSVAEFACTVIEAAPILPHRARVSKGRNHMIVKLTWAGSFVLFALLAAQSDSTALHNELRVGVDTLDALNRLGSLERKAGTFTRSVRRQGNSYIIASSFTGAGGITGYDSLEVDAVTLAPRWQRLHSPRDSGAVNYTANRVQGWVHLHGQPRVRIDRQLPPRTLPDNLVDHVIAAAPWTVGRSLEVHHYDMTVDTIRVATYRAQSQGSLSHRGRQVAVVIVQKDGGPTDTMRGERMIRQRWIDTAARRTLKVQDRPQNTGDGDGYVVIAR
ncbi:MAG: hypothetical protein ACREMA_01780, partial [Longimicrobiales bacterium]